MENIIYFLDGSNISNLSFKEWLEIIREIITIAGIIFGLYTGNKGIQKYLINDVVKSKFKEVCEKNKKIFLLTKQILSNISTKLSKLEPVTEEQLKDIVAITKELSEEANGSSSDIHSLAVFLYETVKDIPTKKMKKNYFERYMSTDFYQLIYSTCIRINYFANNIVDIPKSTKIEYYTEIRNDLKKYLRTKGIKVLKGYHIGLDLSYNSTISIVFSEIINQSTNSYIFKKRYFQFINNNIPIYYELLGSKIYFPPKIISNESTMLGPNQFKLYLVKINYRQTIGRDPVNKVEFIYSNINSMYNFVDSLIDEKIKQNYFDGLNRNNIIDWKNVEKISVLGEESIKIIINENFVKKLFKQNKNNLLQELMKYKN